MSRRFARALLALTLVVPVVVVFSPGASVAARSEYAAVGITEVTHSQRVAEGPPDARIRRGTGVTVGNDIYWPAPQRVSALVRPLGSVIYWVTIENEAASAQRFRMWGTRSSYFRVGYFSEPAPGQPGTLGAQINRGVVRGTRLTPRLEPGEIYRIGMRVTIPLGLPQRFHRWQSRIRVYSTTQAGIWDEVGAITIRMPILVVPVGVVFNPAAAGATRPGPLAAASNGAYTLVDVTDPTVTLTTPPHGATYPRGRTVTADYSCADEPGGSGIASCVGTVENGQPIDTSTLGDYDFIVTAADVAGNTTQVTHTYKVGAARPDARIRRGTGATIGDNIYGSGQTAHAVIRPGGSANYWVTAQNDGGFAERLRLQSTRSDYFIVRYYNPAGNNVTHLIAGRGYLTPRLAPGQIYRVRVVVTVPRALPMPHGWRAYFWVDSTTQPWNHPVHTWGRDWVYITSTTTPGTA